MKIIQHEILVIWSWSGGLTTSLWLKYAGKDVWIIEKDEYMGGDCTNTWCVPSKALLHAAKTNPNQWIVQAMETVRSKRNHFRDEENPKEFAKEHGIPVYEWIGKFIDQNTVEVTPNDWSIPYQIQAKKIIIAVWGRPRRIGIEWLPQEKILTSDSLFEIEDVSNLVIMWWGYIGCEMGEAFARLWVNVTLIQRGNSIINNEEPEISEKIHALLESVWVTIYTNANMLSWDEKELIVEQNGKELSLPYDYLLQSIGRIPNTTLDLDNAEIQYCEKWIVANDYSQTNKKHIFSIGDCVADNPQFTHRVDHEGRVLVRNILFKMLPFVKKSRNTSVLPMVMYTSLEVARIGMTREELNEFYTDEEIRTISIDATTNDRDFLDDVEGSHVIVHFTRTTGQILWATVLWPRAGEMIHTLQLAMQEGLSAWRMMRQINAYPSYTRVFSKVRTQFVFGFIKNAKADSLYLLKANGFKIAAVVAMGLVLWWFFWFKSSTGLTNSDIIMRLYEFFNWNMRWPVLFILACFIRPIFLFPAVLFTILGGVLFGPIRWILYVTIGSMLWATLAWGIGKRFGKSLIKPNSQWVFARIKWLFNPSNSLISVFAIRLIPVHFDIANYSLGILQVPYKAYFWGTLFGIMPPMIAMILAWASLDISQWISREALDIRTSYIVIGVALYLVWIGLTVFAKKWMKKNEKEELIANG